QANAILDMRLQKLTSLEQQKIIEELKELKARIKDYKEILKSEERQYSIVSDELVAVDKQYPAKRRTEVDHSSVDTTNFEVMDLIADEDVVIMLSEDGFVKRMPRDSFRRQRRGGRGIRGAAAKREDHVKRMLVASTHDTLLLFSNKGKVFAVPVHELPEASREARGRSLKALINLANEENISALAATREYTDDQALVMVTRDGILKKSDLSAFSSARKGGIIAVNLRKDDELIDVRLVGPKDDVLIASRLGNALRTNIGKMRSQGRNASGIIGMRLEKDDSIIGMDTVRSNTSLLVISEHGFGKRVAFSNFPAKGRGGKGMTYIKITDKNGPAVRVCGVRDDDDIVVIADSGMTIRMAAGDISQIGRATVGVRVVNLQDNDRVRDVALLSDE
ncbi:MAG: DNA gyrase subunit A, partial [Spirochaetales bacterium]|nr:DNA gyrase subunit A [Spirochaetales bacterium]